MYDGNAQICEHNMNYEIYISGFGIIAKRAKSVNRLL